LAANARIKFPIIAVSPVLAGMSIIETLETRDTLLTVEELGRLLSMSAKTLYKAIKAGRLPAYRVGGIRLDPYDVAEWLRERHSKK
jgi:excisionase family DNA binding protein